MKQLALLAALTVLVGCQTPIDPFGIPEIFNADTPEIFQNDVPEIFDPQLTKEDPSFFENLADQFNLENLGDQFESGWDLLGEGLEKLGIDL